MLYRLLCNTTAIPSLLSHKTLEYSLECSFILGLIYNLYKLVIWFITLNLW